MGGPSEAPELYDLEKDPQESTNLWSEQTESGAALFKEAIAFLRACGTSERFVQPREDSLSAFAAAR
jgi:hypothetical protein